MLSYALTGEEERTVKKLSVDQFRRTMLKNPANLGEGASRRQAHRKRMANVEVGRPTVQAQQGQCQITKEGVFERILAVQPTHHQSNETKCMTAAPENLQTVDVGTAIGVRCNQMWLHSQPRELLPSLDLEKTKIPIESVDGLKNLRRTQSIFAEFLMTARLQYSIPRCTGV